MKEENIPYKVKSVRYKLGLTQSQFASLLGIEEITVHRWESGKSKLLDGTIHVLEIIEQDIEEKGCVQVIEEWSKQERLDCRSAIKYRLEMGMSQLEFAEHLRVSRKTVERWEAGFPPSKQMTMAIKDLVKKHGIRQNLDFLRIEPGRGKR